MEYKLKPGVESFEVVDGAFAGKKYFRGKVYEKIPPEEKHKFEAIKSAEPVKAEKKSGMPEKGKSNSQMVESSNS